MEIRCLLTQAELDEAARLSDSIFRDAEQISMQQAFPGVFSESLGQSFGAFEQGKLVAFMGLVPSVIRIGSASLAVCSLGSVCTDDKYRGKGIASDLLDHVLQQSDKAGASLLLVSGGRSLYTRAGCRTYGQVTSFSWKRADGYSFPDSKLPEGTVLRELAAADWFQLHRLASQREVRYDQGLSELAQLIHSEALSSCLKLRHKIVVAAQDGHLLAYAVVGVPGVHTPKRSPLVIEWGGSAVIVPALLDYAAGAYKLNELTIPVPWHEKKLIAALEGLPAEQKKAAGTVLVISPERLLNQLAPYLQSLDADKAAGLKLEKLEDGITLLTLNGQSIELSVSELTSLLFDPQPELKTEPSLAASLNTFFPIAFPYDAGLNYV